MRIPRTWATASRRGDPTAPASRYAQPRVGPADHLLGRGAVRPAAGLRRPCRLRRLADCQGVRGVDLVHPVGGSAVVRGPRGRSSPEAESGTIWGSYAAAAWRSGVLVNAGCHRWKSSASWSLRTRTRTCNRRCAPRGVQRICCFLTMRLLTSWLTADSTNEVEMVSPAR